MDFEKKRQDIRKLCLRLRPQIANVRRAPNFDSGKSYVSLQYVLHLSPQF